MQIRARISIQTQAGGLFSRGRLIAAVAVVVLAASGCSVAPGFWHYESNERVRQGSGSAFSATKYAASIWSKKIVPLATASAVPVATLLPALASDQGGTDRKYGNQSAGGGDYAFLVKGSGTVVAVDTSNQTGPVTVLLSGLSKPTRVQISTGPVFLGTALRDAFKFIQFGDFENQIQYAQVATALNAQVKAKVVARLDRASLKGKKIDFVGAFAPLPGLTPSIVPTQLTVTR